MFLGGILDQLQETFYGKPEEENGEASGIHLVEHMLHFSNVSLTDSIRHASIFNQFLTFTVLSVHQFLY